MHAGDELMVFFTVRLGFVRDWSAPSMIVSFINENVTFTVMRKIKYSLCQ